ncbi:MAG: hypothetical protein ACI8XO_002593, partial [Verrucomicrobiales bacterium]
GFVALRAGAEGGQVTTRLLEYSGKKLLLNYVVRQGGTLSLEVIDQAGAVIGRSQPLAGDVIDTAIEWLVDPGLSQGVVQLRFKLKQADLFSLRFH